MRHALLVACLVALLPEGPSAAEHALLEALRAADRQAVRTLLRSGADPNVRDSGGATALMYAAIYDSVEEMRLLIDRKADVNAASDSGATALMWAVHDSAKIRLLLDNGAAVNARTRGTPSATALIVAIRAGNVASVRMLLDAGANVKDDTSALVAATQVRGNGEVERLLTAAGVPAPDNAQLSSMLTGGSGAGVLVNIGVAERLIDKGATPPLDIQIAIFRTPFLGLAANEFGLATTRTLLDRGADPNRSGSGGITPLMMAAGAPQPDANVIKLLLDRGADPTARDSRGRTALDWALLQGESPAAQALRDAGSVVSASTALAPVASAPPRSPKDAVEAALRQLRAADAGFLQRARCISCHHQTLPSMALAFARRKGADTLDTVPSGAETTLARWASGRDEVLLGGPGTGISIGGFTGTVAYSLAGFAEENIAPTVLTDALALSLAARQRADGSWNVGDIRPPIEDVSAIHFTALSIRSLQTYMPAGRRTESDARIVRARRYLEAAQPRHTQDSAFRLMGLVWAKASAGAIARERDRLLALQRADGGWGQRPAMAPDAYQTGQVLYALQLSGALPSSTAYQRGVDYLLRTQLADGTWFMQSRAFGFQPYFETGFPHGRDQFISAAATAWAAIALTFAM